MIFAILLAAQAAVAPLEQMKSTMEPLTVAEASALFRKVCFDPFPDPVAAEAAIADPSLGLTKDIKTPSGAMQPGDSWTSARAQVTYASADWLPRDLPSPQCGVTVLLDGSPAHPAVVSEFASLLGLPAGKGGEDKPRSQTQWDVPGRAPDRWRLFVTTETTPSGKQMRAMILNLRGKAKK